MIQKFLAKPFPFEVNLKKELKVLLAITLFPGLFFVLFQPFDIVNEARDWKIYLVIMGFGLVSGFFAFIFTLVLPFVFKKSYRHFTIGKAITHYSSMIVFIAIGNYFYKSYWQDFRDISWESFLTVFERTLLIAVIPTTGIIIWYQHYLLQVHLRSAQEMNERLTQTKSEAELIIQSENKKEHLKVPYHSLLFIENQDNYVMVYFHSTSGVEKKLIRATLNSIEKGIHSENAIRCHRSYIVNLAKVKHVSGNSRGLQLELFDCNITIPVSRSYLKKIREKVNLLS